MGSLSYEHLQPVEELRSPAEALSGSSPIGIHKIIDLTSATMILRNERGELVFGVEVPIQAANRVRAIRTRTGSELTWIRLECKADRTSGELQRNNFLIVTEYPRSNFWWQQARFRSVSKKSRDQRSRDDPATWETDDRDQILERLESLSYDPWETDDRYLTAGISRPAPGMSLHRTRRNKASMAQLYGVTGLEPRALCLELISSHRARRLLSMTKERTIKYWPIRASANARKLLDETIAEASSLLHSAIQQALAGPHTSSSTWTERPVMDLADRIYRSHLYNTNRRYLRQESR